MSANVEVPTILTESVSSTSYSSMTYLVIYLYTYILFDECVSCPGRIIQNVYAVLLGETYLKLFRDLTTRNLHQFEYNPLEVYDTSKSPVEYKGREETEGIHIHKFREVGPNCRKRHPDKRSFKKLNGQMKRVNILPLLK